MVRDRNVLPRVPQGNFPFYYGDGPMRDLLTLTLTYIADSVRAKGSNTHKPHLRLLCGVKVFIMETVK